MKNLLAVLVLGFLALAFACWLYQESTSRYRIAVPHGRHGTTYYTNAYTERAGCLYFCQVLSHDSTQVCGPHSVTRLR